MGYKFWASSQPSDANRFTQPDYGKRLGTPQVVAASEERSVIRQRLQGVECISYEADFRGPSSMSSQQHVESAAGQVSVGTSQNGLVKRVATFHERPEFRLRAKPREPSSLMNDFDETENNLTQNQSPLGWHPDKELRFP